MSPSRWLPILDEGLRQLGNCFVPGELAYLALTSKVEHPVRDKLAFWLHQNLGVSATATVAREWRRFDLAVLEQRAPSMLVEAKAMYSFDMFRGSASSEYPEAITTDLMKMRAYAVDANESAPEIYTLLLSTHPHSAPAPHLDGVVKYGSYIRRYTPAEARAADEMVRVYFSSNPLATHGLWHGGAAFGTEVSVQYWLFGPYELA